MNKKIQQQAKGVLYGSVVSGLVFAYVLTLICSLAYALIVVAVPFTEQSVPIIARAVVMVAAFLGGLVAGRKSERVGWLHGGMVGLLYIATVMLFGRSVTSESVPGVIMLQRLIVTAIVSAIGGIAGVNF